MYIPIPASPNLGKIAMHLQLGCGPGLSLFSLPVNPTINKQNTAISALKLCLCSNLTKYFNFPPFTISSSLNCPNSLLLQGSLPFLPPPKKWIYN